jgi:hypothetical protein
MPAHAGDLLIIHDTTELDYSQRHSLKQLGPIGGGYNRGYLCHNSLVVEPESRHVVGLINQVLHRRPASATPQGEKSLRKRKSAGLKRRRESQLWLAGVAAVPEHLCPAGCRWIDVCDRGADTFEFHEAEQRRQRPYVVRSSANRLIHTTEAPKPDAKLHTWMRKQAAWGQRTLAIKARDQRTARTATLKYAAARVWLAAPRQRRGRHSSVPLPVWVVRVWEVDAPRNEELLEWFLLSSVPVHTPADAKQVIDWYETRWVIEEYHKALKTGMGLEDLQFRSETRLEPAIAVLSVTALTLLNLRAAAQRPDADRRPAEEVIDPLYVEVLDCWRNRRRSVSAMTVREFLLALGRLGGHQNRRRDGMPGWQTLWQGWNQLHAMVAYELARRKRKKLA